MCFCQRVLFEMCCSLLLQINGSREPFGVVGSGRSFRIHRVVLEDQECQVRQVRRVFRGCQGCQRGRVDLGHRVCRGFLELRWGQEVREDRGGRWGRVGRPAPSPDRGRQEVPCFREYRDGLGVRRGREVRVGHVLLRPRRVRVVQEVREVPWYQDHRVSQVGQGGSRSTIRAAGSRRGERQCRDRRADREYRPDPGCRPDRPGRDRLERQYRMDSRDKAGWFGW